MKIGYAWAGKGLGAQLSKTAAGTIFGAGLTEARAGFGVVSFEGATVGSHLANGANNPGSSTARQLLDLIFFTPSAVESYNSCMGK